MDSLTVTREQFRLAKKDELEFLAQALGNVSGTYTTESVDPSAVVLQGAPTLAIGAEPADADNSLRIANTRWVKRNAATASGSPPTTPARGQVWIDTSADPPALKVWDDSPAPGSWKSVQSTVPGALVFKGSKNPGDAAPTTPAAGDVWVMGSAGTMAPTWTGVAGTAVSLHETVVWDGAEWTLLGAAVQTTVHQVTATAPLQAAGTTNVALSIADATATDKGVVQLADGAAVTAGTAGRVVDAAQLKVVSDAVTAAAAGGITGITGTAPITATGTGAIRTIAIADATTTTPGAMSAADKTKLDGVAAGAEVNVQPDWNEATTTSDAFIKNKPTIPAPYVLPIADATTLGGIKKGAGYTIAADGRLDITFPAALTYKGTADPTAAPPATTAVGDVYVANKAGVAAAGWTGLAGTNVALHELLVWDGTEWDGAGVGSTTGVTSVTATPNTGVAVGGTATAPVVSGTDASTTAKGVVQLATAAEAQAGTDTAKAVTAAGVKAAVAALAGTAGPAAGTAGPAAPTSPTKGTLWTDTSGAVPVVKVYDGATWHQLAATDGPTLTGTPSGPTAAAGTNTTQLATTAFVQAAQVWSKTGTTLSPKTSGDLVDAAALPAATAAVQGAVRLADATAITAGTSGRVVDAAQLKAAVPDATTTVKGVVQLADGAAITAGTAGRIVDAAQLKGVKPPDATETVKGIVELATAAETTTGTDATRAVHPAGLKVELDKKLNLTGGNLTGGVTATERTITAGAFDLATGNFWTCGAIAIPNPTNAVAGMSGLIRLTAAPTGWGGFFKHPGGTAPSITAFPAIVPFYVSGASTILCGKPVEGIA